MESESEKWPGFISSYQRGSVSFDQIQNRWVAQIEDKKLPKKMVAYFVISRYGENAKRLALEFLKTVTEQYKLGHDEYVPAEMIGQIVPEEVKQYLIGFAEGDGCISVAKTHKTAMVNIYQSEDSGIPIILKICRHYYGGRIHSYKRKNRQNQRTEHVWMLNKHSDIFLRDWVKHGHLKKKQAEIALNVLDGSMAPEEADRSLKEMHKPTWYKTITFKDLFKLHYIVGLFDAEGSVAVYSVKKKNPKLRARNVSIRARRSRFVARWFTGNGDERIAKAFLTRNEAEEFAKKKFPAMKFPTTGSFNFNIRIAIAQKNSPNLLHMLQQSLNCGTVTTNMLSISNWAECESILKLFLPISNGKKDQVIAALQACDLMKKAKNPGTYDRNEFENKMLKIEEDMRLMKKK